MPHCVIEHSTSIGADELVKAVFSGALKTGLFEPDGSDIKVRALGYESYMTGPSKADFVHVAVRILSGRTPRQKSELSGSVFNEIVSLGYRDLSITVEIVDMDRDSYRKGI